MSFSAEGCHFNTEIKKSRDFKYYWVGKILLFNNTGSMQ